MSTLRYQTVLVVCCLVAGCTDARTSPRQRTQTRRSQATAKASQQEKQVTGTAVATTKVVQATHLESEALPVAKAPSLLDQSSAADSNDGDASHEEADRVLQEAVKALRTKLAVISHNMANANTVGFKRSRVLLEDCGYRQLKLPGAQDAFNNYAPASIAVGHGCRIESVELDFSQGTFEITNNSLDVAIDGEGFFQVIDPSTNNFLYTRTGSFAVNSNGVLVSGSASTGRVVQPQISIPIDTTGVVISAEGNVSIQQYGQTQFSQIGQLQMAKFLNPQGLLKVGEHLYQETLASGAAIFGQPGTNGLGTLCQNALEQSNVDLDEELLAWKATERTLHAFERLLKVPSR